MFIPYVEPVSANQDSYIKYSQKNATALPLETNLIFCQQSPAHS